MSDTDLRNWVPTTRELLIDGRLVPGEGPSIDGLNPATEQVHATVATASIDQVDQAVAAARRAFPAWAAASPQERSAAIHRLADTFEKHTERLTASIVNEVGTPAGFAEVMQVKLGIVHLRWQAEAALVDRTVQLGEWHDPVLSRSEVAYRPAGVVACITGYNYPINLAVFKFGAALAAGCTAVLLPSPRTPLTTLWMGELFEEAGIPAGVLNVVIGDGPSVGQHLTTHPWVDRVSFTGSDAVGAAIMEQAARGLKGVTLELGGKSPNILLPGIDAAALAKDIHLRWARNGGQGCAALARMLVHESLVDDFLGASKEAFTALKVGDPWDRSVNIGPMIREDHRARVQSFIDNGLADGGHIALSLDTPVPDRGFFVNPVVFTGLLARQPAGAERGVRPGRRRRPLLHRGGGDPAGQRHRLRAGRQHLHARRRARPRPGRPAAVGHGLGQRRRQHAPRRALRRLRPLRRRPGDRRVGHPRVPRAAARAVAAVTGRTSATTRTTRAPEGEP